MDSHLSAADIAALVDDDLPAERRAAVEAHLVACAECRSELVAASELTDSAPSTSRSRVRWVNVAAAAVVLLSVLPLLRNRSTSPTHTQRSPTSGVTAIQMVRPANGASAPLDSLTFVWRGVPGAMTYHLFVTDSTGESVLERTTTDTVVGPINDARLSPRSRYFWYVDALSNDGSSVTSHQTGFFIRDR